MGKNLTLRIYISSQYFFFTLAMSKYRGPRLRIVRRLGELSAFTKKSQLRTTRPGQHGATRIKLTQFAYRLVEKQKIRFYYGISEKQLVRYVKISRRIKGSTGKILLKQLEMRLDNIIYCLGFAPTLPAARQLVSHGHILINNKRVTVASFSCSPQQVITVNNKMRIRQLVEQNISDNTRNLTSHLSLNREHLIAIVNQWVVPRNIPLDLNELLVIEYYSNRLLSFLFFV